jgi:hypothetical protein
MRGWLYSSDDRLTDRDLFTLADALAMQTHNLLGARVYNLHRNDIAELIQPYVRDLDSEDREALPWLIWHLFQDARDIALTEEPRRRRR